MSSFYDLLKPVLFSFDAEFVHERALHLLASGAISGRSFSHPKLKRKVFGIDFPNPLGLAAGFDKNAKALLQWESLGFGFVEVGTITRYPQPGNPKPRMFRLPEDRALINRLGFNNEGADAVASRIESTYAKRRPSIPVGINLGKSKATPLEEAHLDYLYSFERLKGLGDYFVVNVSSPNTKGLRSLQNREGLERILGALRQSDPSKVLLVKVAPELNEADLDDVLEVAKKHNLNGIVATNTTLNRDNLNTKFEGGFPTGGLSGAPVRTLANKSLAYLAQNKGDLEIIGVGGVMNGQDLKEKLDLGASLVQSYTGFIYGGPNFPAGALEYLAENS